MSLRETTRLIVKLVEEHSGYPVQIIDDPSLSTFASIRLARRGGVPSHILTYRPSGNQAPDYFIAFQSGFALRLYALPSERRFVIAMSTLGVQRVVKAMEELLKQNDETLGRQEIEQASAQLYGGLITHLSSVPVGLRVARWLHESFPELHELQRSAVNRELELNQEAIQASRVILLPEAVVKPTMAINAAFAQFWAREYGDPDLVAGYSSGPYAQAGERLLSLWDRKPAKSDADVELVDAWAGALGLAGWYTWKPYEAP